MTGHFALWLFLSVVVLIVWRPKERRTCKCGRQPWAFCGCLVPHCRKCHKEFVEGHGRRQ